MVPNLVASGCVGLQLPQSHSQLCHWAGKLGVVVQQRLGTHRLRTTALGGPQPGGLWMCWTTTPSIPAHSPQHYHWAGMLGVVVQQHLGTHRLRTTALEQCYAGGILGNLNGDQSVLFKQRSTIRQVLQGVFTGMEETTHQT